VNPTLELTATAEDYLEAIQKVSEKNGAARVKDIAAELSVHKSTVSLTLKSLAGKGLVEYTPYGAAQLTPAGAVAAGEVTRSHEVIKRFLTRFLGIDDSIAGENACRIEHAIDAGVRERLAALVRFTKHKPEAARKFRASFEDYMEKETNRSSEDAGTYGLAVLSKMKEGDCGIVRKVVGGRGMIHRLAEMGICPGTAIRLVRGRGPSIVECGGHRLIVGRGMVNDILVEPVSSVS
jgi:DtxR family Mn-dependent transcriptional regulator